MSERVYCLDRTISESQHWLGRFNSKVSRYGCPTCLRAEKWRVIRSILNTVDNSHRFPEEIRYMTSAIDYKEIDCKRCGHAWLKHSENCAGPCKNRNASGDRDCSCSHFVKQDEEVTPVPSTNKQGEVMTPYEYLILLVDREKSKATVLVEPTLVLASNEEQVKLLAHRAVPEENVEDLNNIVVIIRLWSNSY